MENYPLIIPFYPFLSGALCSGMAPYGLMLVDSWLKVTVLFSYVYKTKSTFTLFYPTPLYSIPILFYSIPVRSVLISPTLFVGQTYLVYGKLLV